MFARVFAVLPLALLVAAQGQCNTGQPNCCNVSGSPTDPAIQNHLEASGLGGLLSGILASVDGLVGLGCSPIVGTGAKCTQEPICCEGNTFSGLIDVGCSPINVL